MTLFEITCRNIFRSGCRTAQQKFNNLSEMGEKKEKVFPAPWNRFIGGGGPFQRLDLQCNNAKSYNYLLNAGNSRIRPLPLRCGEARYGFTKVYLRDVVKSV